MFPCFGITRGGCLCVLFVVSFFIDHEHSCQVISNVPSAILLSQFTQNYAELLRGVNIGGAGTLIASLASLITFNEYMRHEPKGAKRFIIEFSAFNFAFLAVLLVIFSIF